MDMNDIFQVGSDILQEVGDAIERNDYSNLSSKVKQRVDEAVSDAASPYNNNTQRPYGDPRAGGYGYNGGYARGPQDVRQSAREAAQRYAASHGAGTGAASYRTAYQQKNAARRSDNVINNRRGGAQDRSNPYAARDARKAEIVPFNQKPVSRSSGAGKMAGGILGTVLGGGSAVVNGIGLATAVAGGVVGTALAGPAVLVGLSAAVAAGGVGMVLSADSDSKLINKYYEYGKLIGNQEYVSIKDLAKKLDISEKELIKTLNRMIKKGYLPGATYDKQKTTLLLTDNAREQYRLAELSREQREEEERKQQELAKKQEKFGKKDPVLTDEVKAILDDGNKYIEHVRYINDLIPDTQPMSEKLYRLENIMNRIFAQTRRAPENAKDLRRFMDYYLPTTTKLLNAYVDLMKQDSDVENVAGPLREIEETMDTVNDAFEKLFNSMFQDMAWDISSDISVMKTMMKQDGLTPDGVIAGQEEAAPVFYDEVSGVAETEEES